MLNKLLQRSRLSIVLDCWISFFSQVFMAITGYFVDNNWEYREVFLEFELLYNLYTENNLNSVVINILENYQIIDRILSIITNNTTNNNTIINSIQKKIKIQEIGNTKIFRILYLVYVIQLSLN